MTEPKVYDIPLKVDLTGWRRIRIQVDVLPTGSKDRIVKLKNEFKVLPLSGDTSSYVVQEETKQLINDGASVEFYVTVTAGIDPLMEDRKIQAAIFQVEVQLDLTAMAQLMGSFVSAVTGSGFLGGLVAEYFPKEMELLSGSATVKAQEAVFEITLSKFRWQPLQKKLTDYVKPEDIRSLFQTGGELLVPVQVEEQQQSKDTMLSFDPKERVFDVKGTLNWCGKTIEGVYRDEQRTSVVFEVLPAKEWFEMPAAIPQTPLPGAPKIGYG